MNAHFVYQFLTIIDVVSKNDVSTWSTWTLGLLDYFISMYCSIHILLLMNNVSDSIELTTLRDELNEFREVLRKHQSEESDCFYRIDMDKKWEVDFEKTLLTDLKVDSVRDAEHKIIGAAIQHWPEMGTAIGVMEKSAETIVSFLLEICQSGNIHTLLVKNGDGELEENENDDGIYYEYNDMDKVFIDNPPFIEE